MKKFIKSFLLRALAPLLHSRRLFQFLIKNKLVVFVFHDVSTKPTEFSKQNDLNTPPEVFEKQIEFISKYFKSVHVDELQQALNKKIKIKGSLALVSFDDGYKSLFEYAFPYLEKKSVPAVLFVNGEVFDGHPITSGLICYLSDKNKAFVEFCKSHGIEPMRITPRQLEEYFRLHPATQDLKNQVKTYCGENLKVQELKQFATSKKISYGHHLYNHFCGVSLAPAELRAQIAQNARVLLPFENARFIVSATYGQFDSYLGNSFLSEKFNFVFGRNNGINKEISPILKRLSLPTQAQGEQELIYSMNKTILKSFII